MYVYCRKILHLFVRSLETGKKRAFGEPFYAVPHRVQIYFYLY